MYAAKQRGRARCELFGKPHRERMTERLRVEQDMRRAVERGEFETHYQPIVTLEDGRAVAVEALVRWRHPERGLVYPGEFIAVAEETGLIVQLGTHVLQDACAQLARWDETGGPLAGISASVNLSARQLPQADLLTIVDQALASNDIEPSRLTLEITESVLMEEGIAPEATMALLRRLGVRLALDDFGTGYSSLSYLQRFRLDALKLDRAFVAGLGARRPRRCDHRRRRDDGDRAGDERRRRGDREHLAAPGSPAPRLQARAGLSVRQAGAWRRAARDAARPARRPAAGVLSVERADRRPALPCGQETGAGSGAPSS